ncbi:hypothetical protein X798_01125 [Onchocerca flexuosa]|uniref:Protein BCCIP homolog n=1 Tax=Onchocerca flexuosa TaxID=387005 RepID=A0A238C3J5_9BILA|nr:hypothetical protein X798_01125 [Onchocerca flexuosa]
MKIRKCESGAERLDSSDESTDEDKLMRDDLDDAEKLVFDFEAYPMNDSDKEGLINLLTQAFLKIFLHLRISEFNPKFIFCKTNKIQIFLRADVDVKQMADILVEQSPFGCVYRPAEEFMDEDDEGIVYGALSMLELGRDQKFQADIWTLLKTKAQKYSIDKKILSVLDNLSTADSDIRVGLLINERLLHFPATIASPAFKSLAVDLKKSGAQYRFSHIVLILKIRISDSDGNNGQGRASASNTANNGKKLTKAQKKRIAANAIASAKVIYDNQEEELLFRGDLQFDFFQYPVQSDVEKDSKFGSVVLKGVTYRPYRRVCFLDSNTFHRYIELISSIEEL